MTSPPTMRIARPGPGKGWRQTKRSGRSSSAPTARTSSLNSMRSGSTSSNSRSSGRPPTLWWDLIVAGAGRRRRTRSRPSRGCPGPGSRRPRACAASSSKTRMNSSPMILRLVSGSSTPASRARKRSSASTWTSGMPNWLEGLDHLLGLVHPHQPVVDEDAGELVADRPVDEQRGDRGVDAAGEPADRRGRRRPGRGSPRPARRSPTRATTARSQPAISRRKRVRTSVPYGVCTTSGWNWIP